jgi:hypothetical protein
LSKPILPIETFEVLEHLRPKINISPFSSNSSSFVKGTEGKSIFDNPQFWLNDGKDILYLKSGRDALKTALVEIGLTKNDSVLIVTTTGGKYISSCVTKVIEGICSWENKISGRTRAILIIHEFGFPCQIPEIVKRLNLPIIEDCAYATGTRMEGGNVGKIGDYAIYSISKYFPIPFGGILVTKKDKGSKPLEEELKITGEGKFFLMRHLKNCEDKYKKWNIIRKRNWNYYFENLFEYNITPFFQSNAKNVPGVCVMKFPDDLISKGPKIKEKLNRVGIECTVYYTMGGFYLPTHQFLSEYEKGYVLYHFVSSIL